MKVKLCPHCRQAFSVTAAGVELLFRHLREEHDESEEEAERAVDAATVEERPDPTPRDLPRCH
ncbi:MAG: hypothetical protein U0939_19340 [Pirellulales bacterium]